MVKSSCSGCKPYHSRPPDPDRGRVRVDLLHLVLAEAGLLWSASANCPTGARSLTRQTQGFIGRTSGRHPRRGAVGPRPRSQRDVLTDQPGRRTAHHRRRIRLDRGHPRRSLLGSPTRDCHGRFGRLQASDCVRVRGRRSSRRHHQQASTVLTALAGTASAAGSQAPVCPRRPRRWTAWSSPIERERRQHGGQHQQRRQRNQ